MTSIEQLLSISSESLAPKPGASPKFLRESALYSELYHMLEEKNGFYTFEFALHVFPLTSDPETGLEAWNAGSLWRNDTGISPKACSFLLRTFCRISSAWRKRQSGVHRFHAETGRTTFMAETVEEWAGVILSNFRTETGWPFVHEWQEENGSLPLGKRLMPKAPFFLGGGYKIENLWAGNPLEGMRFEAELSADWWPTSAQEFLRLAVQ